MGWSLAQVQPNRELTTARALTRHQFPNHVFKIKKQSVRRGKHVDHTRPAFPGYIFLVANDAWYMLRERFGITRYVHRDLPQGIVPALVSTADDHDVLPISEAPSIRFKSGDRVLIQGTSPLAHQIGIFQHLVTETDAIVIIDWMGRWVPVLIDEREVVSFESAADPEPSTGRKWRRRKRRQRKERLSGTPVAH